MVTEKFFFVDDLKPRKLFYGNHDVLTVPHPKTVTIDILKS